MKHKNLFIAGIFIGLICSVQLYSQQIVADGTGYPGHIYHLNNYNVGIGTDSPQKPLHIYRYESGYPTIRLQRSYFIDEINSDVHFRWDIEPQDNILKFKFGENTATTIDQVTILGYNSVAPKVGIGVSLPSRNIDILDNSVGGSSIKLTSQYDASILLYADSDNNSGSGESDNPYILFSQDGLAYTSTKALIGLIGTSGYSPYGNTYNNTISNYAFFGANAGICFGTNGTISGGTVRMIIDRYGYISMGGSTSSSYRLKIYGSALASGGVWVNSDQRFKKDIETISDALYKIQKIRGTIYEYDLDKYSEEGFSEGLHYGFIAQELQKVFPEMVKTEDSTGYLAVNYDAMIPVLVEAIKEQQKIIKSQKNQIEDIQTVLNTVNESGFPVSKSNIAILAQNNPNPFNKQTTIEYYIPEDASLSRLMIFDMNGTVIKTYDINLIGKGSTVISANELGEGMYLYSLLIDGKEIATKRMILTK